MFTPTWGNDPIWLISSNIFQMGWNHQLVYCLEDTQTSTSNRCRISKIPIGIFRNPILTRVVTAALLYKYGIVSSTSLGSSIWNPKPFDRILLDDSNLIDPNGGQTDSRHLYLYVEIYSTSSQWSFLMQVFTISAAACGMCQQRGSFEKQDIYHYSDIVLANEGVVCGPNKWCRSWVWSSVWGSWVVIVVSSSRVQAMYRCESNQ